MAGVDQDVRRLDVQFLLKLPADLGKVVVLDSADFGNRHGIDSDDNRATVAVAQRERLDIQGVARRSGQRIGDIDLGHAGAKAWSRRVGGADRQRRQRKDAQKEVVEFHDRQPPRDRIGLGLGSSGLLAQPLYPRCHRSINEKMGSLTAWWGNGNFRPARAVLRPGGTRYL